MLIGSKQMIKNISNLQLNVKIENESIKQVHESKSLAVTTSDVIGKCMAYKLSLLISECAHT